MEDSTQVGLLLDAFELDSFGKLLVKQASVIHTKPYSEDQLSQLGRVGDRRVQYGIWQAVSRPACWSRQEPPTLDLPRLFADNKAA